MKTIHNKLMSDELIDDVLKAACAYCTEMGAGCGHIERDEEFYKECDSEIKERFVRAWEYLFKTGTFNN